MQAPGGRSDIIALWTWAQLNLALGVLQHLEPLSDETGKYPALISVDLYFLCAGHVHTFQEVSTTACLQTSRPMKAFIWVSPDPVIYTSLVWWNSLLNLTSNLDAGPEASGRAAALLEGMQFWALPDALTGAGHAELAGLLQQRAYSIFETYGDAFLRSLSCSIPIAVHPGPLTQKFSLSLSANSFPAPCSTFCACGILPPHSQVHLP